MTDLRRRTFGPMPTREDWLSASKADIERALAADVIRRHPKLYAGYEEDAVKFVRNTMGPSKRDMLLAAEAYGLAPQGTYERSGMKKSQHAAKAPRRRAMPLHARKRINVELGEDLATPAWTKGLDLSESHALGQRLGTVDVEEKQRRIESDRRAALPSLAIMDAGDGVFIRVSSPGPGYSKYHAVVAALKAFQIPIGDAIPPNIFVPVHKAADMTKARTKVEDALRYAGYRV